MPPNSVGVFAGDRMKRGYTWHGEYLVWDLAEFADLDFSLDGARLGRTLSEPMCQNVFRYTAILSVFH